MTSIEWDEVQSATGEGVRVLVVDSGVEASHPALQAPRAPGGDAEIACWTVAGADTDSPSVVKDSEGDVFGHGTAVAALIHQFAPAAGLDSLRVLGANNRGSSKAVVAGMRWGIEQEYDIVNCSFGTGRREHIPAYKRVVDLAFCRNVWLVSACNNQNFRTEEYPAFFPAVISVNYGALPGLVLERRRGCLVEFVARGVQVRVAWKGGGYRTITGSSFAAPHVSALAARIRQLRPGWNVCQAKAALYRLASKPPE